MPSLAWTPLIARRAGLAGCRSRSGTMEAGRRLAWIFRSLTSSSPTLPSGLSSSEPTLSEEGATLGTLTIGDLQADVRQARQPSRLVRSREGATLDLRDPWVKKQLYFLLQKDKLGQDIFLVNAPGGPIARRLALTYCRLLNREYEVVELHRDVGEAELKQGREIRKGGSLDYVDSAAVRAVKGGRILIIEGIEKAERGILPILNNLLENREVNLEDGTHIVHADRLASLKKDKADTRTFIAAHPDFRVIAIGASVPPHIGYPLDPPFRSRFQVRYLDQAGASTTLANRVLIKADHSNELLDKIREVVLVVEYSADYQQPLSSSKSSSIPPFPQTALCKLAQVLKAFPVANPTPEDLTRLLVTVHPALALMKPDGWRSLQVLFEQVNLGISDHLPSSPNDGSGLLGYHLHEIQKSSDSRAKCSFRKDAETITLSMASGPLEFESYPLMDSALLQSPRFQHILNSLLQAHALGWDLSLLPTDGSVSTASSTLLIKSFARLLGYEVETVHLYKELGGRELLMRREIGELGATSWAASPLIKGFSSGALVHLSGVDVLGSTLGSLARLTQDRETELWEDLRMVGDLGDESFRDLMQAHESARVIATVSRTTPAKEWLNEELSNMFLGIHAYSADVAEERQLLTQIGLEDSQLETLLTFTTRYRERMAQNEQKNRKLGTRALKRVAQRLVLCQGQGLYDLLMRTLLADFLPLTSKNDLINLLAECGIDRSSPEWLPPAEVTNSHLIFPATARSKATSIPLFDIKQDPAGASHIPHMSHYFDNAQQTLVMRDMAIDLELSGQHLLLLGNQGVGKNKIVDRLLQLLSRPREYVQLHRDSTVQSLMFQTTLQDGKIRYHDSPMLRAIIKGRVVVIDEADKAPEHVIAVLKSLSEQGEMTLSDGRRVRPQRQALNANNDIVIHPTFRMILLANRPGFPFLGNAFLNVLGDAFSSHAVANPDEQSEVKLLQQLAPELDQQLLIKLVRVFQDLRTGFEDGTLAYPYSLRELINLVRHMKTYKSDSLERSLRNIFDFDVHRPDTMNTLWKILRKHGLPVESVGIESIRKDSSGLGKSVADIDFKPTGSTELDKPKFGKVDDKEHHGGNTWAGGTGGRDTAGLGGRGGYMRLFKGFDIHQIPDELKKDVPEHIQERARQMAKDELARKLKELDMTNSQAIGYESYLSAVRSQIERLKAVLENASANEEERVWLKRQSDGELDESRLTEGLTGESSIYKRRGMEKPELGRPQIKPKRIRFVFDVSASMYRFQMDGRLAKSLETAVMLMESFASLRGKDENKYAIDFYAHSGDSPAIKLIEMNKLPENELERWKVVEKMALCTQYCFAGDYTLEALSEAGKAVSEPKDAYDDRFVIALTDANFERYGITAEAIKHEMQKDWNVKKILIAMGDSRGTDWLPKLLPGRAYSIKDTNDLPTVFQTILSAIAT